MQSHVKLTAILWLFHLSSLTSLCCQSIHITIVTQPTCCWTVEQNMAPVNPVQSEEFRKIQKDVRKVLVEHCNPTCLLEML